MHPTTQATYQLVSIFGGNYVPEQHSDATQRWLSSLDERRLHAVEFSGLLRALRSTLFLGRPA